MDPDRALRRQPWEPARTPFLEAAGTHTVEIVGEMSRRRWILISLGLLALLLAVGARFVLQEMRTSKLQARYLTPVAQEATWWMEEGRSESLVEPGPGPYDLRLGYHGLSERMELAEGRGFRVVAQARTSGRFRSLVEERQLFPIYRSKAQGGLTILDRDGEFLFHNPYPGRVYPAFEDIPPVIWQTLLHVENRTVLDPNYPYRNPAVEWGRFFRSGMELGLRYLGREGSVAGASTLATQIEKFRHAPEGLTESPMDKLRQMASAALRAYQDGPETMEARKRMVRDYLNSVPLAAIRGDGEVTGLADGLRAWYGADFVEVNRALHPVPTRRVGAIPAAEELVAPARLAKIRDGGGATPSSRPFVQVASVEDWDSPPAAAPDAGLAYRQVLSLILSQRRPSFYLTTQDGREALDQLTTRYLDQLEADAAVPAWLVQAARQARPELRVLPPERPSVSFVERKAVNTVRTGLLGLLDVPRLYELDRMDLTARSSIDAVAQATATELLGKLHDPAFIRQQGFDGFRLLDRGSPGEVIYSIALHERTPRGNLVRIQVDNLDAPFNLNESARLELGSTAKLRTLATYLDVIAELHETFSPLSPDSLRSHQVANQDRLSAWARERILNRPGESLEDLLRASMQRGYSANPGERFVTGGGVQTFSNFDRTYDQQVLSVEVGFRHSVNLVFVRMMRDIVNHYMYRVPGSTAHVLEERGTPLRQEYLARFADREGIQFLNQFIPRYRGKNRPEILESLFQERRLSPQRMAWVYRTAVPGASVEELEVILSRNLPQDRFSVDAVADLFRRADPEPHSLSDLGYLANVHPLELWAARFFIENPDATGAEAIRASEEARQEVYQWLFRTSRTRAQDQRIRALLEVEAFTQILRGWQRVGYPFQNIVPSLGTSIGSSGDRPAALNELVGIILNDGVRLPTYRVEELHFAPGTPFETLMERYAVEGQQVMAPAVARVLREAMVDVVENGTARRSRGVVRGLDGTVLPVGGKTGTGDNRFRVFASGGRLVESRPVNRTSTFVFFIGDRYYGVISAYVPGEVADQYHFTSALPTQVLRELGPSIEALLLGDLLTPPGGEAVPGPRPPGTN